MDKGVTPSLFVNDGSFLERFKQLQQEKENGRGAAVEESKLGKAVSGNLTIGKTSTASKANDTRKTTHAASGGKLAFSLKQKSKIVTAAVKLGEDEDEDRTDVVNLSGNAPTKRQKLGQPDAAEEFSGQVDVAPPSPSDSTVKIVADKLANFVAKHGRQFEHITRQKNPGDNPFKFLFDESCADYKYYEYRLAIEEKTLKQTREVESSRGSSTASKSTSGSLRSNSKQPSYQTPASALYEAPEDPTYGNSLGKTGESTAPTGSDPIAMMEYYVKKAAQEERRRQPKHSKDEMPPPASLQALSGKKGHHMGDYIPQEELEKFMAACNDAAAQKATKEAADRAKIQADNVGHKLLSKMGWKEGEGLGSSRRGISDPIMAGNVKKDNLGVGAQQPGEVTPEDDIYEQYKKRMMLGYRHRPNPLNNPRKAYY
ncbi:SURP and G-patch domain-containing protein 1-like protein isoform X2 [Argentina anserina]|uniref:SURP and G-patch domain-containing protein 1-like protein isoform X2 n=1 Tax=Argentina anserina TaxID=57926 RepID=UPI00217621C5|nr:SURP and G-patch domain-containing protein 1-like protein isoform X2 [Potentilla anserina]